MVAAPPRKKILICKIFWNMTRPTAVSFIVSVMYGCLIVTQVFLSDPKTTRFIPCVHFCESQVVNSIIYGVKVLQIRRFVDDRRWGTIANRRRDTIRFPVESMKDCLNFPETMTDLLVQKKFKVHKATAITKLIMLVFTFQFRREECLTPWHLTLSLSSTRKLQVPRRRFRCSHT